MRMLAISPHLTNEHIIQNLVLCRGTPAFCRWQLLYLIQVANQRSAAVIAPLLGMSKSSIYKMVAAYNKQGPAALCCKPRGGRRNALLSIEEEQQLFKNITLQTAKGVIYTANDIRQWVETKVGKAVSDDFLLDILHRNGWNKKQYRNYHAVKKVGKKIVVEKTVRICWKCR